MKQCFKNFTKFSIWGQLVEAFYDLYLFLFLAFLNARQTLALLFDFVVIFVSIHKFTKF